MTLLANLIASLFLGLGAFVATANVFLLWRQWKHQRAGGVGGVSLIPLVAQISACAAAAASASAIDPWWSTPWYWAVALCDVSLPILLSSLPRLFREFAAHRR